MARAQELRLRGWVANAVDGSVRFACAGPAEDVHALLAWARQGPVSALVDALDVEILDAAVPLPDPFVVRRDGHAT